MAASAAPRKAGKSSSLPYGVALTLFYKGRLERLFITRQYLGIDTCVIVTAKYTSDNSSAENGRLSKEVLFPALVSVVRKYAILGVRVKDERTPLATFERLESVDFNSIVKFSEAYLDDENNFSAFLEQEFMQHIPNSGEGPLWRLAVSADNFVVFAWSHVIGDGKSGLAFHRALLDALNNPTSQQSNISRDGVLSIPGDVDHLPPLEELTELKPSIGAIAATIARLFVPRSWYERSVWSGNKVIQSTCQQTKTFVRFVFVSAEESSRLVALSREHGTTLTGVIYVAAIGVLSNLLSEETKSNPSLRKLSQVTTTVAVSLRPIAQVSDEAIGNIVSIYNSKEKLKPFARDERGALMNFPWNSAASYSKRLREAIPKTRNLAGMLKYIKKYEELYKDTVGKKRSAGLEVSNLGAFKISQRAGAVKEAGEVPFTWSIGRTYFAQDDGVLGAALKLSVTGDPEGAVNIVVSWGEGAIDTEFAESFVREYRALLASLAKGEDA